MSFCVCAGLCSHQKAECRWGRRGPRWDERQDRKDLETCWEQPQRRPCRQRLLSYRSLPEWALQQQGATPRGFLATQMPPLDLLPPNLQSKTILRGPLGTFNYAKCCQQLRGQGGKRRGGAPLEAQLPALQTTVPGVMWLCLHLCCTGLVQRCCAQTKSIMLSFWCSQNRPQIPCLCRKFSHSQEHPLIVEFIF